MRILCGGGGCIRCTLQGALLGRQDKVSTAGDGGVDEVQQGVGLITFLEGQASCHIGTEGQQPADSILGCMMGIDWLGVLMHAQCVSCFGE